MLFRQGKLKRVLISLFFIIGVSLFPQENFNNPDGTGIFEEGNTTINSIPFIDLNVRSPENNSEVALSLQL